MNDAAEIIVRLSLSNSTNEIYNISSNETYSIAQIIDKLSGILKKRFTIKEIKPTLGDPLHNLANINKIKFLKYKFQFNLKKGLIHTIKNIRK